MGIEIAPPNVDRKQRVHDGAGGVGNHGLVADHIAHGTPAPGALVHAPFALA